MGIEEWKGDPKVISSSGFREECRKLYELNDPEMLLTYILTCEHVDEAMIVRASDPSEFDQWRRDPELRERLIRIAEEIISSPSGS